MKRRVAIKEVYERLIGIHRYCNGYQQCGAEIADILEVSHVAIHKVIMKLKDDGLIVPSGKRGNCVYYSPTKRKPQWLIKTHNHAGVGTFQCSKSQWSCPINQMPAKSLLKGWEKREMQNGVVQYLLEYPFLKPVEGYLKFRILGKRKYTISVDFSKLNLREDEIKDHKNCALWIEEFVKMALSWVKKKFNIVLDVNNVYSSLSPHFETDLREVDAKQFIENARITIEYSDGKKIMIDRSKNKDNFETTYPPWLKEYVELPSYRERFHKMEQELIPRIINVDEKIDKLLDILEQQQESNENRMKENLERGVII